MPVFSCNFVNDFVTKTFVLSMCWLARIMEKYMPIKKTDKDNMKREDKKEKVKKKATKDRNT